VAEDEVVEQVDAQKNASQNKGRTHQEIHGSTLKRLCRDIYNTQSMPGTLIADRVERS
jgi:hypothetical protein